MSLDSTAGAGMPLAPRAKSSKERVFHVEHKYGVSQYNGEKYDKLNENKFLKVLEEPLSTFSVATWNDIYKIRNTY